MTAKDLKNALLQEAVQGKLVPQIASEGNARDLLEEIRKARGESLPLATARKRSSATPSAGSNAARNACSKSHSELVSESIPEDEIPFVIPESWCWCRLSDIGEINRGRSQHRPRNDISLYENGTIPFIQTGDVAKANGIILEPKTFYNEKGLSQSKLWKKGTICLTIAANIGDVAVLNFDACFPDSVVGFNGYEKVSDNKYVMYTLMWYKDLLDKLSHSTAQKNINLEILSKIAFPLPPLAEQKRIVAAIEKFMPLIEEYGKKETVLNELNAQIGTLTKKAILQEAVQGKLVPQIPAEGNAKDLLEQIKAQKAALIKEGKIKKEKPLPEITEDEIPFDIPENWCYITPIDVGYFMAGQTPKPSELLKAGDIPYFKVSDMNNEGNELYMNTVINYLNPNTKYKLIPAKSIIYPKNGGAVFTNKKRILKKDSLVDLNTGAYVPFEGIDFDYLFLLFSNIDFKQYYKGTALPTVDTDAVKKIIWGLPPLAEQKRIVAAIEQLLPLCERLGK